VSRRASRGRSPRRSTSGSTTSSEPGRERPAGGHRRRAAARAPGRRLRQKLGQRARPARRPRASLLEPLDRALERRRVGLVDDPGQVGVGRVDRGPAHQDRGPEGRQEDEEHELRRQARRRAGSCVRARLAHRGGIPRRCIGAGPAILEPGGRRADNPPTGR
jgi:hypothetical protein